MQTFRQTPIEIQLKASAMATPAKKTFIAEVKSLIKNTGRNTTAHGIRNIIDASFLPTRIIWIVAFLAALGYCLYLLINISILYAQYQTVISTSEIHESPANFPAVVICNLNPFNEKHALDYIKNISTQLPENKCLGGDITNIDSWDTCFETNSSDDVLNTVLTKIKRVVANSDLTDYEKFINGFDLDYDMLISCKFNGFTCDSSNFTKFWHNEYGYCYSFNSGENMPILVTSQFGLEYGLKLELATLPPDTDSLFTYKSGIYLLVLNQSQPSLSLNGGIQISTGQETYVGVMRTLISKQPKPYSDCIIDLTPFSDYSNVLFSYFKQFNITNYDEQQCFDFCYQDKLVDKCKCVSTLTDPIRNTSFCQSTDELECESSFDGFFSSTNINSLCDNICRQECEAEIYDLTTESAFFPTFQHLKFLNSTSANRFLPSNESDYEWFAQKGLLRVIVNYKTLKYKKITESPATTFEQFLGNFGGQLGLFIGISFLSLVELIEIISEMIALYFQRRKSVASTN